MTVHARHRRLSWRRPWLALVIACACLWQAAAAQVPNAASESAVKAAFLYRIAAFVEWPAGTFGRPEDPLVIAVAGNEAVATDLDQIVAGRTVDGRPVLVRRIREGDAPGAAHVLMIGAGRDTRVREITAAAAGPVLVVTEQENGHRLGGVLNFVVEGGRVRFTASLPVAEARNLRLSARLLAVAQYVEGRSR